MKVIIVGSGIAGVKTARSLAKDARFQITLISDRDHFEYHAALYRSATGRSHLEVCVPLKSIFAEEPQVAIVQDRIVTIDNDDQVVVSESGNSYHYDVLILALGVVTEYYGINGLAHHAYGIKSLDEADRLKAHLHSELSDGHAPDSNYVVVGAGPTGVELAGELHAYLMQLRKWHRVRQHSFKIYLVEAAPRILPTLPEDFSKKVHQRLERMGVEVLTGVAVQGETSDTLDLPNGKSIKTHLVVWTAGVTNNPFFVAQAVFKLGRGKRVEVGPDLLAAPNVYVIGDSASTPLSGMAQTAVYDGHYIAENLKRKFDGKAPLNYEPKMPIAAIPVGPGWCAVAHGKTRLYGRAGWLVRRQLDWKLYSALLSRPLARKTWLFGSKREETCPECAKAIGMPASI